VIVYCDGSVVNNGSKSAEAGYGYLVTSRSGELLTVGGGYLPPPSTNNRAEITGMLVAVAGLYKVNHVEPFTVFSDSQYVVNGVNQWMDGWVCHGDLRSGRIKNADLWEAAYWYKQRLTFKMRWVAGHSGHPENELVDGVAGYCRRNRVTGTWDSGALEFKTVLAQFKVPRGKKRAVAFLQQALDAARGMEVYNA